MLDKVSTRPCSRMWYLLGNLSTHSSWSKRYGTRNSRSVNIWTYRICKIAELSTRTFEFEAPAKLNSPNVTKVFCMRHRKLTCRNHVTWHIRWNIDKFNSLVFWTKIKHKGRGAHSVFQKSKKYFNSFELEVLATTANSILGSVDTGAVGAVREEQRQDFEQNQDPGPNYS